jgi:phosphatidylserine decarboxylase
MIKPHANLAPEGLPSIALAFLATLTFAFLEWWLLAVLALVLAGFTVNFFRDPERVVPRDDKVAVAPADGKVVSVGPAEDPITGERLERVCIFMNVFNVHVNRAPLACTVREIKYTPGKFINASLDKASEDNERCALGIIDEDGDHWTVVQIAGLVARRIVLRAEEGDDLTRGERFGMIKFGSRVDVYMPPAYSSQLRVGDKTVAGQTIVARRTQGAA